MKSEWILLLTLCVGITPAPITTRPGESTTNHLDQPGDAARSTLEMARWNKLQFNTIQILKTGRLPAVLTSDTKKASQLIVHMANSDAPLWLRLIAKNTCDNTDIQLVTHLSWQNTMGRIWNTPEARPAFDYIMGNLEIAFRTEFAILDYQRRITMTDDLNNHLVIYGNDPREDFHFVHVSFDLGRHKDGELYVRPYGQLANHTRVYLGQPHKDLRLRRGHLEEPPDQDNGTYSLQDEEIETRRSINHPPTGPKVSESTFIGYDCGLPQDIKTVRAPVPEECEKRFNRIITRGKQTYFVMQEVNSYRITTKTCTLTRTSVPVYCGNYDHQTLNLPDVEMRKPIQISADDCRKYHESKTYTVEVVPTDSQVKTLSFTLSGDDGARNQIQYESHGKTIVSETEVECQGVEWLSPEAHTKVQNIVRWVQDEIVLNTQTILVKAEGRMAIYDSQIRLPATCSPHLGKCESRDITYTWTPPSEDDQCRVFLSRESHGEEYQVSTTAGPQTIYVDNEKLIRLVKKDPLTKCGRVMYRTNFQQFFLYDDLEDPWPKSKERQINDKDLSVVTYFNHQDSWLLQTVRNEMKEFIAALLEKWCKEEQAENTQQFGDLAAKVHARAKGETVQLHQNRFATAAGELWYTYLCREVTAFAQDKEVCYDALPVQLKPVDRDLALTVEKERRRKKNSTHDNLPIGEIQFFLEPLTRRLTTVANIIPCTSYLAPGYENDQGRWMIAAPELIPTTTPEVLGRSSFFDIGLNETVHGSWEDGGLYSMDALQRFEEYQLMPRVKDQAVTNIAEGTFSATYTPAARQRYYLHNLGIPDLQISIWQSLWNRIQTTGALFSFFIGVYVIIMLVVRTIRYIFIGAAPDGQTWGRKLLNILCPTFVAAFQYYRSARRTHRTHTSSWDDNKDQFQQLLSAPSTPGVTYRRANSPSPDEKQKAECQGCQEEDPSSPPPHVERSSFRPETPIRPILKRTASSLHSRPETPIKPVYPQLSPPPVSTTDVFRRAADALVAIETAKDPLYQNLIPRAEQTRLTTFAATTHH